jgi:uncharacterized protein YjlB
MTGLTGLTDYWQRLGLVGRTGEPGSPEAMVCRDDGIIPNSPLPVLIYRGDSGERAALEGLFAATAWPVQWAGGIFAFQHYHSTAHEVLGVTGGQAHVQLGGASGDVVTLSRGDIVIIPAGVAHCRLQADSDFEVVGGYPANQPEWDLCRADAALHATAKARIARVPPPPANPVTGADEPWAQSPTRHLSDPQRAPS